MAEYTNDLRIKEIGIGEEAGAWGTTLNTQLGLLAEGFSYGVENLGSDANATITMANGASDEARSLYLKITSTSLSATRTVTLAPQSVSKVWIIENATSGSQSITITQGGGQHGVTIPNGQVKIVYSTGDSESPSGVYDALDNLELGGAATAATSVTAPLIEGSTSIQTPLIEYTDGDDAITIADGGGITAANGITSTAAANTFGATSFNDADITNVGNIYVDQILSDASPAVITIGAGSSDTLHIKGMLNTNLELADGVKALFGGANDFAIYHDGSNNIIEALKSDSDIIFKGNDGGSPGDTTAMTIDMSAAGNVGIGTASPTSSAGWARFLHIDGGSSNALILDGTDSQQGSIGAVDGLYIDSTGHSTATNNKIIFRTQSSNSNYNGVERLQITSAGDIAAGANATGAALIKGVSGDQDDRNAGGYPQYTFVGNEGTGMRRRDANRLAFDAGGDTIMQLEADGTVEFNTGTSSPTQQLALKHLGTYSGFGPNTSDGNDNHGIGLEGGGPGAGSNSRGAGLWVYGNEAAHGGDAIIQLGASGQFELYGGSGATEYMRIQSNGGLRVGGTNFSNINGGMHAITLADDASIAISASGVGTGGGAILCIYEQGSGDSAIVHIGYNQSSIISQQGSGYGFANSDTDGDFCIITSGHVITFKNRSGISRNFNIGAYGAGNVNYNTS